MTAVIEPVLHGHWLAEGYVFDMERTDPAVVAARVLALWTPGTKIYQLGEYLLVFLDAPVMQDCRIAPALPLIKLGGGYATAPFTEKHAEALRLADGKIAIVRSGEPRVLRLADAAAVDIAEWIDISAFRQLDLGALGEAPEAPPPAVIDPAKKETRDILNVAGPADDLGQFLAEMSGGRRFHRPTFGGIVAALAGLLPALGRRRKESGDPSLSPRRAPSAPSLPPLFRLKAMISRGLYFGLLSGIVGRRQSKYMQRMIEMFEGGDLADALRHAIPLGAAQNFLNQPLFPSFGLPSPRASLTIQTWLSASKSILFGGGFDLYAKLQELYRRAHDELDRAGRIHEAAFVLAELLNDAPAAVAYLERHGQYRLAAELAEGRGLEPAVVIRQWNLAGEVNRALDFAKRFGAFGEAYRLLPRDHKNLAIKVGALWVWTLLQAGDYERVLQLVWSDEKLAAAVGAAPDFCLDRVIESRSWSNACVLAEALVRAPQHYEKLFAAARELLDSADPLDRQARRALVHALKLHKVTTDSSQIRAVARLALRSVLRDLPRDGHGWTRDDVSHLDGLAADRCLRADLPDLNRFFVPPDSESLLRNRPEPLALKFGARGTTPIHDAVPLPNQRALVALGQAGVRMVGSRGQTLCEFPVPAHELVLSDAGNRAIAIADAGSFVRLARLDLDRRTFSDWGECRLERWARTYNGTVWFVARRDRLMAIDVLAPEIKTLWDDPELPGPLIALGRSPSSLAALFAASGQLTAWRYDLPQLRRAYTGELRMSEEMLPAIKSLALRGDIFVAMLGRLPDGGLEFLQTDAYAMPFNIDLGTASGAYALRLAVSANWIAAPVGQDGDIVIHLLDYNSRFDNKVRARVTLRDAGRVSLGFDEDMLLIADRAGRLIRLDLARGVTVSELTL
ncbi:MAG: bpX6 domain-containing protein [Candidatus Sumerlaeia bacterium]